MKIELQENEIEFQGIEIEIQEDQFKFHQNENFQEHHGMCSEISLGNQVDLYLTLIILIT